MASEVPNAGVEVSQEEMERAIANLKEGKEFIDDDPEKAVEQLCAALRVYEKRYGSEALECADVYLHYGIALYEVARNATDALGTSKTAVAALQGQKAEEDAAEAGPSGCDASAEPGQQNAASDAPNPDPAEGEKPAPATAGAAETAPAAAEAETAPAAAEAEKATPAAAEAEKAAPAAMEEDKKEEDKTVPAAAETEQAAPAAADAEKTAPEATEGDEKAAPAEDDEVKKEGEEGEEGSDEEGDAEGAEGAEGEGAEGAESDDMKLAWEMIELARVIYSKHPAEQHHSKLAEVHKSLGDISGEQERFEEAVECYKQSLEHLQAMQPPSKRRIAEVQYKLSLALTFQELPEEAMQQTQAAIASLEAAVAETEEKLAALPTDGTGGEAAEEEGRRLQATSDDLRAVMTELQYNCEGLKETIDNNHSIKEALRQAFLKASGTPGGAAADAAAAAGTTSSSFAAPSAANAQAVLLGVVGRGTKRITLQPTVAATTQTQIQQQPAAAGAAPAKRSLADLMGGAPIGGAALGAAGVAEQGEAQAKKARTEEPEKTENATPAAAEVTMEGQ